MESFNHEIRKIQLQLAKEIKMNSYLDFPLLIPHIL